ncbi:hypothetical protein Tco_1488149, partial [Tanacetum coccineum]
VRIGQKSQEYSQNQANTDTRFRRVQKEAKEAKPKAQSLSQFSSTRANLAISEKGAGTFTVHPSFPKLPRYQIRGQIQIKGCVGQFKEAQAQMQGQISLIKGILILLSRRATSTMKEAQINVGFCTKILTKEAQTSHQWNDTLAILRCPLLDQTVTNEAQMIEEMNGRD